MFRFIISTLILCDILRWHVRQPPFTAECSRSPPASSASKHPKSSEKLFTVNSSDYGHIVIQILGTDSEHWCPQYHLLIRVSQATVKSNNTAALICAYTFTRILKTAMRVDLNKALHFFSSAAKSGDGGNLIENLKALAQLLVFDSGRTIAARSSGFATEELLRIISLHLLKENQMTMSLIWWRVLKTFKGPNRKNLGRRNCVELFQAAVPALLHQTEEYASAAALDLLDSIVHLRSQKSSIHIDRECMLTEARLHLVQKRFSHAKNLLKTALERHQGAKDALAMETFCLLNHAREALLEWDSYEEHYSQLSAVLTFLFHTDAPHASQCIAPFSALSTPLSPQHLLKIAASAARRELVRLPEARARAAYWHRGVPSLLPSAYSARFVGQRMRVAYITSEFGDNSVGREIAAVVAAHSRQRVQVFCFSLLSVSVVPDRPGGTGEEWRRRISRCHATSKRL